MRRLLAPLSWLYGWIVSRRRRARRRTPPQRLPVPVLSVGNITTGGTGKTEAVVLLCRLLLARGLRPAVLSRGYRRRSREAHLIVSRGAGPEVTVQAAGDEPYLLARRLPRAAVLVGADRMATGRRAVLELKCNVLVLDDGFQRRNFIHHDFDLVLVDAAEPFGRDYLLPAGNLREPVSALAEADLLLLTRADQFAVAPVLDRLQRTAPKVPVLTSRHRPVSATPIAGGPEQALEILKGKRLLAVSGIARPEAFRATLADLGLEVAGHIRFPDHYWYSDADRRRLRQRAAALGADVITTSKDAVRMGWSAEDPVRAWSLDVELEILSGAPALELKLESIFK
jgi:tetraacyldisaccharide 4'-kinase